MSDKAPFPFEGPTRSRFYFNCGDHWVVRTDDEMIAGLLKKQYPRWHFAVGCLLIPLIIFSAGIAIYSFTGKPLAIWSGLAASLAAGVPMFFIYRSELAHLDELPRNTFVLRSDHSVVILDETYEIDSISDLTFQYTYYRCVDFEGSSGYSELDVELADGSETRRFNLLSQTSNWALKHARKLEKLTGIPVQRKTITRNE